MSNSKRNLHGIDMFEVALNIVKQQLYALRNNLPTDLTGPFI